MFDGLADELIQFCEYAIKHPITKVALVLFGILFLSAICCIISAHVSMNNRIRKRSSGRR